MTKDMAIRGGGSGSRAQARRQVMQRRRPSKRCVTRSMKNRLIVWAGTENKTPLVKRQMFALLDHARELMRPRHKGQAYGALTAKQFFIFESLVRYAYAHDGECNRSYNWIMWAAKCSKPTVAKALDALEQLGLLTRIRRITRRRMTGQLFGIVETLVHRVSNAYKFPTGPLPRLDAQPNVRGIAPVKRKQPANSHVQKSQATTRDVLDRRGPSTVTPSNSDKLSAPTATPFIELIPSVIWEMGMDVRLHPAFTSIKDAPPKAGRKVFRLFAGADQP